MIRIGIGMLFLITLFISLLIIIYLKNSKNNKQKIMQLIRNTQTECWENTLYLQEKDRERLAEELHDNIISRLNLIRLNTDYKNMNELSVDLKNSMQIIRELSHNLTPPDLEEIELIDLIADYLEQINKNIEVKYYHHISRNAPINTQTKLNIFRILQELINNILKHAHATQIDISLRISLNHLILTAKDNGCGFSMESSCRGIGLRSIHSRAKLIKAVYKFKTTSEKGTNFIICVSLKSNKNEKYKN